MSKKKKKEKAEEKKSKPPVPEAGEPRRKLEEKDYLKELRRLQLEMVKLQEWVKAKGDGQEIRAPIVTGRFRERGI